jgi:hypothetical protein
MNKASQSLNSPMPKDNFPPLFAQKERDREEKRRLRD